MGKRLLAWWEGLRPGRQVLVAYPLVLTVLTLGHVAFATRITLARSIGYSLFEAVVITGLVVLATQAEFARRRGDGDH